MEKTPFSLGLRILRECFSSPRSWFVMGIAATSIFILSVLLQNWLFIYEVLFRPETLFYRIYGAIWLQVWHALKLMGGFGFWSLWLLALLFGANMALVAYLRRRRHEDSSSLSGKGILGTVIGILGLGCLACNASILGTALASVGGISLITLLPFRGREFLFLGLLLGFYSLLSLAKTAERKTCPIPVPTDKV
jgi:hypothetical protein